MNYPARKSFLLALPFMWSLTGHAQAFQNLDFESANVSGYGSGPAFVPTSLALPGWTSYTYGSPSSSVFYNTVSLGAAAVSLQGPGSLEPIFQGSYTVILQASTGGAPGGAAIGQTAQVPASSQSLLFLGAPSEILQVTFNGQLLPTVELGTGPNDVQYGANISAFAGQTGQLLFTAPQNGGGSLDNIQFSPNVIPEPQTWTLLLCTTAALALKRR